MRHSRLRSVGLFASAVVLLAGCTTDQTSGPVRPADTAAGTTLAIGVDLPFAGSLIDASVDTMRAMDLYLEQVGGRAGRYRVELIKYDNAPGSPGNWDDTECIRNANNHVAHRREVAVIGSYFSVCSKIQMPILNAATDGPMLMVSHTDHNPGLTKTWEPGEPATYFPSGKRSYGRVVTTDDIQGPAAAQLATKDLGVKKCFVLNDGDTYGKGLARAFAEEARRQGIRIVGEERWRHRASSYRALFAPARAAGADCVYFGGIYDHGGEQLTRDKVAVLGDNSAVKLIAPDGFTGYPDFLKLAGSAGAYLTYAGLPIEELAALRGTTARFLTDYRARYGADPRSPYAFYGVQALQVVLAAIENSDGTRRGVRNQVFDGAGITIGAGRAILGKTISIDSATGDANINDVTVLLVRDGKETFVKVAFT